MPEIDREKVRKSFKDAVNMAATELDNWLRTPASHAVGWKGSDGRGRESVGHASGRCIVNILAKGTMTSPRDYAHCGRWLGFYPPPFGAAAANIYTSRWRYGLMNWGHDPL